MGSHSMPQGNGPPLHKSRLEEAEALLTLSEDDCGRISLFLPL